MLTLPIKKKWFDMIKSGEKKEEYREIKPYWTKRFCNALYDLELGNSTKTIYKGQGTVVLQNGYQKNAPRIKCFVELRQDYGKEEWGAIHPLTKYYVLKILKVEDYNE